MSYAYDVIVNGNFEQSPVAIGWTGSTEEVGGPGSAHNESAYIRNGNTRNHVTELDLNATDTTHGSISQVMTIKGAQDTVLKLDVALRDAATLYAAGDARREGIVVEILDSDGNVLTWTDDAGTVHVARMEIYPTVKNTWVNYSLPVSFPAAGTYTLRLTDLGQINSLGAVIDNISMIVCFTAESRILTPRGERRAGDLQRGDLVMTRDHGAQPIRWIGQRQIGAAEQMANPDLRPVEFAPGALAPDQPLRRTRLSPQHRVRLSGWTTQLLFGEDEVFAPARALVDGKVVRVVESCAPVTYVHFMFDAHEVVTADGMDCESFLATPLSVAALAPAARAELLALFPELAPTARAGETARPVLRNFEVRALVAASLPRAGD